MIRYIMLLPVLLPVAAGALLGVMDVKEKKTMHIYVFAVLFVTLLSALLTSAGSEEEMSLVLFDIAPGITIYFHADLLSDLFCILMSFVWLMVAMAAFEYMGHEQNEKRFYAFYMIVGGMLGAIAYSGNLVTLYLFYELMTITSFPLVLHSMTPEAIHAALKYLFYSIGGAFMVLFGIFVFASMGMDTSFVPGGILAGADHSAMLMAALMLMIIGFGTKAGMFPMHGWLPVAHPVAPAPASAVLSGAITKVGVLGILRTVYYIAGVDFLRGTWVQYTWMTLALITVFMGSMLAFKENLLKKRLAYSTVSQVSYILFGLSVMHPLAFMGAVMHIVFHSLVKNTLFLSAGAIICRTGKTLVDQLKGIGKEMPIVMWCFLLVSITLIGIPPTSAFVSKWYLASGSLAAGIPTFSWLGPVILLISAILTAGYLLPIAINGFFPGEDFDSREITNRDPSYLMTVPIGILTLLSVVLGILPGGLMNLIQQISGTLF